MNIKPYLFAGAVLVLLGCIVYVLSIESADPSVSITPAEAEKFTKATTLQYRSDDGAELKVSYAGDLVRVTGFGYEEATLRQVPAASGVKYEGENGLVFHSKDDEVLFETPQERLFTGREVTSEDAVYPDTSTEPDVVVEPIDSMDTATSSIPNLAGVWRFESGRNDGVVIALVNPDRYTLTFTDDGSVAGATDCNGFGGSYTLDGNMLTLTDFMSTMMFCEGSSEQVYKDFLSRQALAVAMTETTLTLTSDSLELQFIR